MARAFFSLETKSSLITTNREQPQISRFVEDAALESASSAKRDDAKAFLREFVRELSREISLTTKLIALVLIAAFITGVLYICFAVNSELRQSRKQSEEQANIIKRLEDKLGQTSDQIGELDKTYKDLMKTVSLAPNLRVEYGGAICLIVGVYDLVDKRSGKVLRYADPQSFRPNPYEPTESEDPGRPVMPPQIGLTTDGNGATVEYDFIGTGFHVGEVNRDPIDENQINLGVRHTDGFDHMLDGRLRSAVEVEFPPAPLRGDEVVQFRVKTETCHHGGGRSFLARAEILQGWRNR